MSWVVNDNRISSSGNPRGPVPQRQNRIARLARMFSSPSLSISQDSTSEEHEGAEDRSRNVFVVGENEEVVQHLKEVLPNVPYQVPVASCLDEADHVLLVVETAIFSSAEIIAALQEYKEQKKKLMILYLTIESRNVEGFLKRVPKEYASVQDVEWVPYLTSKQCLDYQHAAIVTVLQTYSLMETLSHVDKWDFFLSHKQISSQGVAADLYSQLERQQFRVWWDVKAKNLSVPGMMNGVAKSDNFVLILNKDTLRSNYVEREVEQAIKFDKNIVVLYDLRMNFGGDAKINLVRHMITAKQEHHRHIIVSATWIPIDMKEHFSDAMVNRLLKACDMVAPNVSLISELNSRFVNELQGKTFQAAREFHQGTRQWILDKFDVWSSTSTGNKVFAVTGQAGIGKTTLSAELVRRGHQTSSPSKPRIVAFHYFDHREPDGAANARNALFRICYQLRSSIPGFRTAMDSHIAQDTNVSTWDDLQVLVMSLIVKPANQISMFYPDTHPRQIIVLDALDECTQGQDLKHVLFDAWQSIDVPSWLGLYVTCRPEIIDFYTSEIEADNNGVTMLITDNERNKSDVRIVLSNWLHDLTDEQTISQIVNRSEGVFLYLRFVKEMIDKFKSNHPGKKFTTVAQFPEGLGGYYKRYFTRLCDVVGEEMFQRLLGSILASRGPLPLELWMRSCGVEGDLNDDTRTDTVFKNFEAAMEVCKSLMHIPQSLEHEGITFIHKSIPDYLTGSRKTKGSALERTEEKFHIPARGPGCNALLEQVQHVFQHLDEQCATVTKTYSYRNLFALLCGVEKTGEAQAMLFDLDSLLTWLAASSPSEVLREIYHLLPPNLMQHKDIQVVVKLLRLGQHALMSQDFGIEKEIGKQFRSQLPSQILGRLSKQNADANPRLKQLRDAANLYDPGVPWVKPAAASLLSALPGGLVQTLTGHSSSVWSVAYNHDGTRIVSGSSDKTVRIWDALTGTQIGKPLTSHSSSVNSAEYNHDGTRIVSGSSDRTLQIWDALTGEPIGNRTGHSQEVFSVAYNHDGTRIVSGSHYKTIRIWDALIGARIGKPLTGHSSAVNSVAYNHDGSRIVSGSSDNSIRIWDASTGEPIGKPLTGHSSDINSVAYNHDGTRIVTGSNDKTIRIWDANTGESIGKPWTGNLSSVLSVAYNHDGTRIVSGSNDKTIRIWDALTGAPIGRPLTGHSSSVNSVEYNHDGTRIVSGSHDTTVRIWDALTGAPIGKSLSGHSSLVKSAAYNHDGTRFISGSNDKTLRIWDALTGAPIGEPLAGHSSWVNSVAYNHDGTRIVSGSDDETLRVWNALTGAPIGIPLVGHSSFVKSVAYNHNGTRIVSGSGDMTLRIWDALTGEPIGKPLTGHVSFVNSVAYNHDGTRIVSGADDKTIRIWDTLTGAQIGKPLTGHSSWVSSVAYNHDGTRIVSGSLDKTLRIWDALTGTQIGEPLTGHSHWVTSVAYNHDGTRIVSGSDDMTLRVWDALTGAPIGEPLTGHSHWVTSVAYNHDGTRIVSGSDDKTLRVWDAQAGASAGVPKSIGFTPDIARNTVPTESLIACVPDGERLHILHLIKP